MLSVNYKTISLDVFNLNAQSPNQNYPSQLAFLFDFFSTPKNEFKLFFSEIYNVLNPCKTNFEIHYDPTQDRPYESRFDYLSNFVSLNASFAAAMMAFRLIQNNTDNQSMVLPLQMSTSIGISLLFSQPYTMTSLLPDNNPIHYIKPVISDIPFWLVLMMVPLVVQSMVDQEYCNYSYPKQSFCGPYDCQIDQEEKRRRFYLETFTGFVLMTYNRFFNIFQKNSIQSKLHDHIVDTKIDIDLLPEIDGSLFNARDYFCLNFVVNIAVFLCFYFSYQMCDIDLKHNPNTNDDFFKFVGIRNFIALTYAFLSPLMVQKTMFPPENSRYVICEKIYQNGCVERIPKFRLKHNGYPPVLSQLLRSNAFVMCSNIILDQVFFVTEDVKDDQLNYICNLFFLTQLCAAYFIRFHSFFANTLLQDQQVDNLYHPV